MYLRSKEETEVTLESSPSLQQIMNPSSSVIFNFYFSDALDLITFTNRRIKNYLTARLLARVENPLATYIKDFVNFEHLCSLFNSYEVDIFNHYIQFLDSQNNELFRPTLSSRISNIRQTTNNGLISGIIDEIRTLERDIRTRNRSESLRPLNELVLDEESEANLENMLES